MTISSDSALSSLPLGVMPSSTASRRDTTGPKMELDRELGPNAREYWLKIEDYFNGRCTRSELDVVVARVLPRSKFKFHNKLLFTIFHNVYKRTSLPPKPGVPLFNPLHNHQDTDSSLQMIDEKYSDSLTTEQWRLKYREREVRSFANADQRGLQGLLSFDKKIREQTIWKNIRTPLPTPPYSIVGDDSPSNMGSDTSTPLSSVSTSDIKTPALQDANLLPRLCTESNSTPSMDELRGIQEAYARLEGLNGIESDECTTLLALGVEYMIRSYITEIMGRSHSDTPPFGSRAYYYENLRTSLSADDESVDDTEIYTEHLTNKATNIDNSIENLNHNADVEEAEVIHHSSKEHTSRKDRSPVKPVINSIFSKASIDEDNDDVDVDAQNAKDNIRRSGRRRSSRNSSISDLSPFSSVGEIQDAFEKDGGKKLVEKTSNEYKEHNGKSKRLRDEIDKGLDSGKLDKRVNNENIQSEMDDLSTTRSKHISKKIEGTGLVEISLSDIKLTSEIKPQFYTHSVGGIHSHNKLTITPEDVDGTLEEAVGLSKKVRKLSINSSEFF